MPQVLSSSSKKSTSYGTDSAFDLSAEGGSMERLKTPSRCGWRQTQFSTVTGTSASIMRATARSKRDDSTPLSNCYFKNDRVFQAYLGCVVIRLIAWSRAASKLAAYAHIRPPD